jgi:hypothetical protein
MLYSNFGQQKFSYYSLLALALLLSMVTPAQATTFGVTSALAAPEMVLPGQSVSLKADVQASAAASSMIVDLEIDNSEGTKLAQTFFQGQNFAAGQARTYSWTYPVPAGTAAGSYTLKLGVFTAGWAANPYWNNSVASYQVLKSQGPSASGTTIPSAAQIVDSGGNVWTLASGVVMKNGMPAGYSANVILLLYYNSVIYQENSADNWWSWNGSSWVGINGDPRATTATNGECGTSNGESLTTAPATNLCSAGSASAVSGSGPWSWSCAGSNGGTTAYCSASLKQLDGQIPAGWPRNFVIGVSVWQPSTQFSYLGAAGEPKWGGTYIYLSGGINRGWQTWGSGFVPNFVNKARAGGSLPVFTYYMLVGSPPNPNDGQPQSDLNTPATMAAYFADFTALMKQLAAVGGPVVVHIEPDMWGYLEPGGLHQSVSVASSGNPDLASLPDTAAGLQQAYVTLRSKYAPNVILAAHVSTWSWNTSTDCSLNVASVAATDAAFMTGANWDLYFTDIAFGDAGAPRGTWWDANNTKCPNFNVLNSWATAFTKNTNRRLVLWQTPAGNTIYDTENNSAWHYQDNRAQYWLQNYPGDGHLAALAKAGVIGILFTGGEPTPTDIYDAAGDGTTNPPAINGNTAKSTVGDDDGGGLRAWTLNYYSKPLALQ